MAALYALIAFGGLLAGFITTLAGLGSVITLFILIEVAGLDPDVANGTNRIGIMAMSLMALPTFYKGGHLNLRRDWTIIAALFIGAIIGVVMVQEIDNSSFRAIFRYLLIVMLFLVLFNPQKRIRAKLDEERIKWWMLPLFLILGIYAGFIQVGTSVLLVVFLVMACSYKVVDANGIKLSAIGLYTIVCIAVFAANDRIDWGAGLALAAGEAIGAYIAARVSVGYPKANKMVRHLLIVMLVIAIIEMFGLHKLVLG